MGVFAIAFLALASPPIDARACEAMVGSEYAEPAEIVAFDFDPAAWHVASRVRSDAFARKDLVKSSETLSDWTELVSWQITFGRPRLDLDAVQNEFLQALDYECSDVKSAVLRRAERELVYEWWHGQCYDRPPQHHIERLVIGQIGTHLLSYGRKGPKLADAERDSWLERLGRLEVRSRVPTGTRGPLEQGRMALWTRDYSKAFELLQPLAEKGDAEAQDEIAGMYAAGWGVGQSYAQALAWFRKAAAQKNAAATYNVGRIYDNGWGVSQDTAEALRWYRSAAELGDAHAQGRVGYLLATSREPEYAEAAKWFRSSIERGHEHGVYWMGRLHEEGWGMPRNTAAALRFYRQAAAAGDPDAQARLGVLYREGRGVERNDALAKLWVERAATQGNADAQALFDAHYRPARQDTLPDTRSTETVQTPAEKRGESSLPLPPGYSWPAPESEQPTSSTPR